MKTSNPTSGNGSGIPNEDLLVKRATEGLSAEEIGELEALTGDNPPADWDLAAAALDLVWTEAGADASANLPPALAAKIRAQARDLFPDPAHSRARPVSARVLPWLALAAGLLIAIAGWWPRLVGPPAGSPEEQLTARLPLPAPGGTPEAEAPPVTLAWTATTDPAVNADRVSGELEWSAERQAGVMRIRGLAANDPGREQYQLWIFDRERDERYPVDGGVFDIPSGAAEAEIAFEAKLPVGEAYLFAVTVEPPGGVVVSDRSRIALLAQAADA